MDIFRELAQKMEVRDFVKLTCCDKRLRKLYHERGMIWKRFLEKDFTYKYHESYDVDRYIICFKRKWGVRLEYIKVKTDTLTYIDFDTRFATIFTALENWGLIYNNRPVISQYIFVILLSCMIIFLDDTMTVKEFASKSFSSLVVCTRYDEVTKYKSKSYELFIELTKIVNLFDAKNFQTLIRNEDVFLYKNHPNYEEAKLLWLDIGFSL